MNINQRIILLILYSFILFIPNSLIAQTPSSTVTITLNDVSVEALKIEILQTKAPYSISVLDFRKTQKISQQLSLQEYIESVPGLFTLNANNFAQDLRISIRGFGARSAFGIRGIKIIVDGIPETTPDGQGQLDNLPIGLINKIEVLRGPSASLYGNASGGVIYINTLDSLLGEHHSVRSLFGSYNLKSHQLMSFLNNENTNAVIYLNNTQTDGYRNHSGLKQNIFNVKLKHKYSSKSFINLQFNYTNSPIAQDAGGLTLNEVEGNRKQARQRNFDYNTFEKIDQLKIGLNWVKKFSPKWDLNSYTFFSTRDFYGKLPFEFGGIIDLDRKYYGLGSRLTYSKSNQNLFHQFQIGLESAFQIDERNRFLNLKGIQGTNVFSQIESFNNFAFYFLDEMRFNNWVFRSSIRFDNLSIGTDNFIFNKKYNVFNPSFGLSREIKNNQYFFINFSTSFETPTLSELSANPSGSEGLNLKLEPSKAFNYELGWKVSKPKFLIEASLFYIMSSNDILPYELEDFPGRSFYSNTGATKRMGLELFTQLNWKDFQIKGSFTKAKYTFDDDKIIDQGFESNDLPGIPRNQFFFNITHTSKNEWITKLTFENIGNFYANNSNTVLIDSYQKTRFQMGKSLRLKWGKIDLFGGVNNLLNLKYFDNIRLNAFSSRYYEPAATRNIFTGFSFSF
jgi:iron complex outermembrane receptor protein